MKTQVIKFSEVVIKRAAQDTAVGQLRDERYPVRFRFSKDRLSGSWHLVTNHSGGNHWKKIGNWPALSFLGIKEILPGLVRQVAADKDATNLVNTFKTVADLLAWYRDRSATARNLTKARKGVIKWAIDKHLIPTLGRVAPVELTRTVLDSAFFWPKQSQLENSTLRSIWAVLKQAFNQAFIFEMIQSDMMAGVHYADFISAKIQPKATEIHTQEVAEIVRHCTQSVKPEFVLVLLMLLQGTRIGETRRLKWAQVDQDANTLLFEGDQVKNRKDHVIPLTSYVVQVLNAYRAYQKKRRYSGVWLFPNKTRKNGINADQANKWIKGVSGGEWCSHSLRKAARTIWLDIGIDYLIGEMLLNHSLSKLDQAYIHTHAQTQKRHALDKYHEWLDQKTGFYLSQYGVETLTRSDAQAMHLKPNKDAGLTHE